MVQPFWLICLIVWWQVKKPAVPSEVLSFHITQPFSSFSGFAQTGEYQLDPNQIPYKYLPTLFTQRSASIWAQLGLLKPSSSGVIMVQPFILICFRYTDWQLILLFFPFSNLRSWIDLWNAENLIIDSFCLGHPPRNMKTGTVEWPHGEVGRVKHFSPDGNCEHDTKDKDKRSPQNNKKRYAFQIYSRNLPES